jgi:hypothetical protein
MGEQMAVAPNLDADGRADFDFYLGVWDTKNRRLKEWLNGCDTWEEFSGTHVAHKLLDGIGHMDEATLDIPTGRVAFLTVRLFDPQTRLWSIYGANSSQGILSAPQIGRFENGRGLFYAHEVLEGRAIFSRYLWTPMSDTACRWEQAFSEDGGATWETNWIADFTRRLDYSARIP